MEKGNRYGRLLVIGIYRNSANRIICKCVCDCGKEKDIYAYNLINGKSTSCGCYQKEVITKINTKIPIERYSDIFMKRDSGSTYESIGREYGVSRQAIKYICDNKR